MMFYSSPVTPRANNLKLCSLHIFLRELCLSVSLSISVFVCLSVCVSLPRALLRHTTLPAGDGDASAGVCKLARHDVILGEYISCTVKVISWSLPTVS